MQILKFTNDGSELVMQLVDPEHPRTREEARANTNPDVSLWVIRTNVDLVGLVKE